MFDDIGELLMPLLLMWGAYVTLRGLKNAVTNGAKPAAKLGLQLWLRSLRK